MPRGGENHAQGGEKIAQGGEKNSRALRARRTVYFFPPLVNFSCTPLWSISVCVNVQVCTKMFTWSISVC